MCVTAQIAQHVNLLDLQAITIADAGFVGVRNSLTPAGRAN